MKIHFFYERILIDDTGGAFRREPDNDGTFSLIYTFSGGDDLVVLDGMSERQADDVLFNIALAGLNYAPYIVVTSEADDGSPLDMFNIQVGKPRENQDPDE